MRIEKTTRPSRLLRVREFQDKLGKKPATAQVKSKPKGKSRFVAPYYLEDQDRAALEALMADAGLGDADGRQLFITAVEYEVGTHRPHLQEGTQPIAPPAPQPAPHSKADIELAQLGEAAGQILALLQRTHKGARGTLAKRMSEADPFGRDYGERYLAQLELELERMAEACRLRVQEPSPPPPPQLSEAARRLIAQLARIFRECLEVRLGADEIPAFCRVLCLLRDSAQIHFPCEPEVIAGVVGERP
jgi:hypothetical protein